MNNVMASTTRTTEALEEEIEAKKEIIASLPPQTDRLAKAKHQKTLGDLEEKLQLLLEEQRVADTVRRHEELHPTIRKNVHCVSRI